MRGSKDRKTSVWNNRKTGKCTRVYPLSHPAVYTQQSKQGNQRKERGRAKGRNEGRGRGRGKPKSLPVHLLYNRRFDSEARLFVVTRRHGIGGLSVWGMHLGAATPTGKNNDIPISTPTMSTVPLLTKPQLAPACKLPAPHDKASCIRNSPLERTQGDPDRRFASQYSISQWRRRLLAPSPTRQAHTRQQQLSAAPKHDGGLEEGVPSPVSSRRQPHGI